MRNANRDGNHEQVRGFFRKEKYEVLDCYNFHKGFPDLMIYDHWNDRVVLVEIKDGSKPQSARKLLPSQVKFFEKFPCCQVVKNLEECKDLIWEWQILSKSKTIDYDMSKQKLKPARRLK